MTSAQILWRPSASRRRQSQLAGFVDFVNERHNLSLPLAKVVRIVEDAKTRKVCIMNGAVELAVSSL